MSLMGALGSLTLFRACTRLIYALYFVIFGILYLASAR